MFFIYIDLLGFSSFEYKYCQKNYDSIFFYKLCGELVFNVKLIYLFNYY